MKYTLLLILIASCALTTHAQDTNDIALLELGNSTPNHVASKQAFVKNHYLMKLDSLLKKTKSKKEALEVELNSSVTQNVLIGKLTINTKTFQFEYLWGTHHTICLEQPCGYWTFPAAVWQEQEDTRKYFIE